MTDVADFSAADLAHAYRRGSLGPVEAFEAVLKRVESCEPTLNALWALDVEGARAAARASQARWKSGEPLSDLDGVPCTIKENIATVGTPVPLGTAATELRPAERDGPPAARLREAGAVIFAKTTMPDLGMLSSGLSSFHKLTRNPWDVTRNPGGSSAGAGAAAAAGYGPCHVGTDIGGSIRLPADWCGVFGLKPSLGRVPIEPPFPGRVAGPMTRTVDDAAAMMAILSRPDPRDGMSLPPAELDWRVAPIDPRGRRVGLWLDAGFGLPLDPQVRAAVEACARALAEEGADVVEMKPFLTRAMMDGVDRFWRARAAVDLAKMAPERRAAVLPFIRAWAAPGAECSGAQLYEAYAQMHVMRDATLAATRGLDVVLSPVAPIVGFAAEAAGPTGDPATSLDHIGFTVGYNMSEQPAASVNWTYAADGAPIGVQLAAGRFDDIAALRWAKLIEALRPPQRFWPTTA